MRRVTIEWRHLEVGGETCERCCDTGDSLELLVQQLNKECAHAGVAVDLEEVALGPERIAESNLILVDGVPLEATAPLLRVGMSACGSCGDPTGKEEQCRTIEVDGQSHEVPPPYLIREAVCRVANCC